MVANERDEFVIVRLLALGALVLYGERQRDGRERYAFRVAKLWIWFGVAFGVGTNISLGIAVRQRPEYCLVDRVARAYTRIVQRAIKHFLECIPIGVNTTRIEATEGVDDRGLFFFAFLDFCVDFLLVLPLLALGERRKSPLLGQPRDPFR